MIEFHLTVNPLWREINNLMIFLFDANLTLYHFLTAWKIFVSNYLRLLMTLYIFFVETIVSIEKRKFNLPWLKKNMNTRIIISISLAIFLLLNDKSKIIYLLCVVNCKNKWSLYYQKYSQENTYLTYHYSMSMIFLEIYFFLLVYRKRYRIINSIHKQRRSSICPD